MNVALLLTSFEKAYFIFWGKKLEKTGCNYTQPQKIVNFNV